MRKRIQKKESMDQIIERRNKRLLSFFHHYFDQDRVKIHGDKNKPAIILDDKFVLNCYAHNFDLIFTDKDFKGNSLYTIKLQQKPYQEYLGEKEFFHWIDGYEHRQCYYIQVKGTKLRLSGYNFKDKNPENKEDGNKYPVFSEFNYKLYFTKEYADEIIKDYSSKTLNLEII